MLTREVMGAALLGLAWVTALLVAFDAWIDVRRWRSALARWRTTLHAGVVETPTLAIAAVEQRVKPLDGALPALAFFDRAFTNSVTGGPVRVEEESVEVVGTPGAEVWFDDDARESAAACPSTEAFDALADRAEAPGGALRIVTWTVDAPSAVWIEGERDKSTLRATLISAFDPRHEARRRAWVGLGLITANFAWVALGTALVFTGSRFGLMCMLGASILLVHFLGMTPLAMAWRERTRSPAMRPLRGTWTRPTSQLAPRAVA